MQQWHYEWITWADCHVTSLTYHVGQNILHHKINWMEVKKGLGIFKVKSVFSPSCEKGKKKRLFALVCTCYKAVIYRNENKLPFYNWHYLITYNPWCRICKELMISGLADPVWALFPESYWTYGENSQVLYKHKCLLELSPGPMLCNHYLGKGSFVAKQKFNLETESQ